MLWRYVHLVMDCLAPQGVGGETCELVIKPAGRAFREQPRRLPKARTEE